MIEYNKLLEKLESCGLKEYKPRFWPGKGSGLTSGKTNWKQPYVTSRKWFGTLLLEQSRFEGRTTVKVSDESKGYSKLIASVTGLDRPEGERVYQEVSEELSGKGGKFLGKDL